MNDINPYNCSKPGNLFVGYERLRRQVLAGFQNGNSFAILGGRRCGKTSLLMQIQKDLQTSELGPFVPLPRFLDIQGLGRLTATLLFETIYGLVVREIAARPWVPGETGKEYQNFLQHLDAAEPILDNAYGPDWLVVLLVDELDAAVSSLADDQFFQNLRNFLMMSRFHRHFRLVASGVKDLANLISSGSSPLNNLRHKYLGILSGKQARQLIAFGFPEGLDSEVGLLLFQLTGRHPYLLQGLLEKSWEYRVELDGRSIRRVAREFLAEHHDFSRWLATFGPSERAVYQCLQQTSEGTLHVRDIRHHIDSSLAPHIDEALTILSYHGVIDDSEPDEPQIAGTLFRDWYRNNIPRLEKAAVSQPSQRGEGETPVVGPKINVQVNPIIEVRGERGSGPTVDEVLRMFESLSIELSRLRLAERTKLEAQHALERGRIELKEPEAGGPNKEVVKSALEQATGILKAAGATSESASSFIEKAEKLAPYLGKAVGWLAALL